MKTIKTICLITALLFFGNLFSQENEVVARLSVKTLDNFINVKGLAQNKTTTYKDVYNYLLLSLKKGPNGNYSKNTQSGEFSLAPAEEKELSTLKINIQEGEECKIFLYIRKEDVLVSKDSTIIYSAEGQALKEFINESEIEIFGLVIEDAKTKLGKDFYDYFYQKYQISGAKYPFIINIIEKPSMGRGSKIVVDIDDKVVFEFMTRPDDEYIEKAANLALRYVSNYATQRKLLYKNRKI